MEETDYWSILKDTVQSIYSSMLTFNEALTFNNELMSSRKLKNEIETSSNHLLVSLSIEDASGRSGRMAFLLEDKAATAVEFYMLQGFSEINQEIVEGTIDANKEFVQNISDNFVAYLTTNELGFFDLTITDIEVIDDIVNSNLKSYTGFKTYQWEQNQFDLSVSTDVFVLFDPFTAEMFKTIEVDETKEDEEDEDSVNKSKNGTSKVTKVDENIIVEIEDCDQRKKIYQEELENIKILLGVELKLTVIIGQRKMLLKDLINLDIGTTIELEQTIKDPMDILINGVKIAEGEIVIVNGRFGVQITKITSKKERISKIKG